MYDHTHRYRCTIIRGKAQSEIESLIPIYADIILSSEGLDKENFELHFNSKLSNALPSPTEKTLDNHRTEIANKLYGMYFFKDGRLVAAKRTIRVSEDNDLPSFFKSIITYFQFPNGMDAVQTIRDRMDFGIKIRPFHLIISLLDLAHKENLTLLKRELAYYVLDSLDALKGIASPQEILNLIKQDRDASKERKVEYYTDNREKKPSSFSMQHISEQLNILELTNLITQHSEGHEKKVVLNGAEDNFIQEIISSGYSTLPFEAYSYDDLKLLRQKWQEFFCLEPLGIVIPETSSQALINTSDAEGRIFSSSSPLDIGDEGERIVFGYEKERVSVFNKRLAQQKVLLLGKQRGLGYDIQSVWADMAGEFSKQPDASFYIEVKSTKRITAPSVAANDNITLTRNEYLAAEQHQENFAIYRVYLTTKGVFVYKVFNPLSSDAVCSPLCTPIKYNYEFTMAGEIEQWL